MMIFFWRKPPSVTYLYCEDTHWRYNSFKTSLVRAFSATEPLRAAPITSKNQAGRARSVPKAIVFPPHQNKVTRE